MVSLSKLNGLYKIGKKVMLLPELYFYFWFVFFMIWEFRGKNLGKTWNFWCWCSSSYKNIWELRGNNLGITWEKVDICLE